MIRIIALSLLIFSACSSSKTDTSHITVQENEVGWQLLVDGEPMIVNGMNWDYFPIGTNYEYVLWEESDAFIEEALNHEMGLLEEAGVNAIRVYTGIPARWIEYIYDNFGIYTMLNHSFGRYGLTLDGEWVGDTRYDDPRVEEILLDEVTTLAAEYRGTPGLLLYLLGNENNYGLFWSGAETEDIPNDDDPVARERARAMYQLFNKAAVAMKAIDDTRPVAIANGDLQFLDIISEELPDMDIFGTNTYRGLTFGDLYERVQNEYGKPVLLTEFGADAYNAIDQEEDQLCQARYKRSNWKDIYANAAGIRESGNSLGGFTFQYSDGWWKHGQTVDLDVHNTAATWSNGAYQCDYAEGENNMNEEWFGVMAKGPTNEDGFYKLEPRAAYFVLKEAHEYNPYAGDASMQTLEQHFENISLEEAHERAMQYDQ